MMTDKPLFSTYEETLSGRLSRWLQHNVTKYFSPPETPLYFDVLRNPELMEYLAWRSQIDLKNEFAERVFCQDLIWQVIQLSGKQIENEDIKSLLKKYIDSIDQNFYATIKKIILQFLDDADAYYQNYADQETGTLFVSLPNKMVRGVIDEINASFDHYEKELSVEEMDENEVEEKTFYQAAKESLQAGYHVLRKHPWKVIGAIASTVAIMYAGKRSESTNFNPLTMPQFPQWAMPSWQMTNVLTQATVAYGLSMASVGREFAVQSAFLAGFTSLLSEVRAAAPTVVNPIPDQIVEVGAPFNYTFRSDYVFNETDGGTLALTFKLTDGSPLPGWLQRKINASLLSSYATPGSAHRLCHTNDTAYVAGYGGGVHALNITKLTAISYLTGYSTPGLTYDLSIQNEILYVANGLEGLLCLNASNPNVLSYLGRYDSPGNTVGLSISNHLVYLAESGAVREPGVYIIEVENPTNPLSQGGYGTPGCDTGGITFVGDLVYAAYFRASTGCSGVLVVNASQPTALTYVNSYSGSGDARDLKVSNKQIYVANGLSGLLILDANNLSVLRSFYLAGRAAGIDVIADRLVCLASWDAGIHFIDVSDPTEFYYLGGFDTPGWALDVDFLGTTVLVADFDPGVHAIDIGTWMLYGTPPSRAIYTINLTACNELNECATDQFRINVGNVTTTSFSSTTSTSSTFTLTGARSTSSTTMPARSSTLTSSSGFFNRSKTTTSTSTPQDTLSSEVSSSKDANGSGFRILMLVLPIGGGLLLTMILAGLVYGRKHYRRNEAKQDQVEMQAVPSTFPNGDDKKATAAPSQYRKAILPSTQVGEPLRGTEYADMRSNGGDGLPPDYANSGRVSVVALSQHGLFPSPYGKTSAVGDSDLPEAQYGTVPRDDAHVLKQGEILPDAITSTEYQATPVWEVHYQKSPSDLRSSSSGAFSPSGSPTK